MKPAGVLLAVILLVAGTSLICEAGDLALPESNCIQDTVPGAVKLKPVKPNLNPGGGVGTSTTGDIVSSIAQMKEELANDSMGAEYPGGWAAWQKFLNKNMKFLNDSNDNPISGTVEVQFVVDEEGNVTDVKVISGSEPLSTEVVRVIKKSNKWTPGRQLSTGRCIRSFKKQSFIFWGDEELPMKQ